MRHGGSTFYYCLACDGGLDAVIASQRVGAKRRPMTGSAKQSSFREATKKAGLLRRFAPRNDGECAAHATKRNVTPPSTNESPDTAWPFALAASRTLAMSFTLNVSPLMMSLAPFTKRNLALGSASSGSPSLPVLTGIPMILPQCSASTSGSGLSISTPVKARVTSPAIDFCQSGPAGGYGPKTS